MTFAEKLKRVMSDLSIKQVQVVCMTGKSKSSVSQYLSGIQTPSESVQSEIAVALGLSPEYFKKMDEPPELTKSEIEMTQGSIPRLRTVDAAKAMRIGRKALEQGLIQGVFPWGYAIFMGKNEEGKPRYNYYINKTRFEEIEHVRI